MKKTYKILSKFFFLLFCFALVLNSSFIIPNCFSQPSITWQRLYDSPVHMQAHSYGICDGLNGNFYIVGDAFTTTNIATNVIKINSYGDTIWNKIYNYGSRYSIVSLSSSACIIAGTFKLNPNGDLVWTNSTDGEDVSIIKTSDNGFIQCGSIYNFNGYVQKIDSGGNTQWEKILQSGFDVGFRSLVEAADGGYLLYGTITDIETEPAESYLVKLDLNGNKLWEKRYQFYNRLTTGVSIKKTNQNYVLGGNCSDSLNTHGTTFIMRVDNNGNEMYKKIFSIPEITDEYLNDIEEININKYVIATDRLVNIVDTNNTRIKIIDSLGNIITEKFFSATGYAKLEYILPLNNGDILFTGYADFINNNRPKFYTVRTDSLLNAPPLNGITPIGNSMPNNFVLYQNYPNPFNPETKIKFEVPYSAQVSIKVYDLLGREVWNYKDVKTTGSYSVTFDGANLASGVYFYRLEAGNFVESKKMVLIK